MKLFFSPLEDIQASNGRGFVKKQNQVLILFMAQCTRCARVCMNFRHHRRRSEVIRLFLIVGWAHNQNISYHIKPGIAGNIIDIGQIPGFVS